MDIDKRFLTAKDVMEITGRKKSKAYKIISELNQELRNKGYLTLNGKVVSSYFYERFFGKEKE